MPLQLIHVPLVDWEVSDVRTADARRSPMTFSVRPLVDHILVDYIKYKGWSHVVYIHDGANGWLTGLCMECSSILTQNRWGTICLWIILGWVIFSNPKYIFFTNRLQAPTDEEFFREFLNDFHRRMPVHVIVDLEGGYRMRMFLRALEESVLVKKEYHYVFANFEMEDADLASFHYSLINITGFQMFDRMDKKFV
ncbi:unnamed protein product [Strongylus vulgaris]|uniref:Receptor ligand binding region domain-containing protein n=1 Tax=Strongylus vulgaris TaxID=40348 RepID=A0A3P7JTE1_STRVU|nr:unnamed protein product [Strongylus vulgaris]